MDDDRGCFIVILVVVAIVASIYMGIVEIHDHGYRDGRIDAIQGNVKYELRDQADGSRAWETRSE